MGLRGPGAVSRGTRGAPEVFPGRATWDVTASRAERVIQFIESLKITSGAHAGRPFLLRPWQREILHAWYATDDAGRRIVRTGLLTMARKNGKTALCAALALAHLIGPEMESRGQIVAAASDRDQSALIFDELCAFIHHNPAYTQRCNVLRHPKIIEDLVSGSKFTALSSDAKKAHGLSPSVIILDELAQWGREGLGRDLYTALTTATGARAEPLTLIISTQTADELAIMSELVDLGKKMNAGEIVDPTFSAHIFAAPQEADPFDESTWPLANPALGDFRSLDEMRQAAERAKQMPSNLPAFRVYYLNQRAYVEEQWLPLDAWDACRRELETAPGMERRAFIGLDLSTTTDLSALVTVIPDGLGQYDVRAEFWCPKDTIAARSQQDRVPYQLWMEQGYLHATPGNTIEYAYIAQRLHALMAEYEIIEVHVDPWNARPFVAQLQADGLPITLVPQTWANLSSPCKELERLILAQQLRHDGHPVLRWCVSNAVRAVDVNGNIKPKKRRPIDRIDGVSALVTALHGLAAVPNPSAVFEERGLLVLGDDLPVPTVPRTYATAVEARQQPPHLADHARPLPYRTRRRPPADQRQGELF